MRRWNSAMSFFGSAAVFRWCSNPSGMVGGTGFAAFLADDRRQPLGQLDVPVNGLRTAGVQGGVANR
jgi:hypothetical protein